MPFNPQKEQDSYHSTKFLIKLPTPPNAPYAAGVGPGPGMQKPMTTKMMMMIDDDDEGGYNKR
jgi:hypothetical protein